MGLENTYVVGNVDIMAGYHKKMMHRKKKKYVEEDGLLWQSCLTEIRHSKPVCTVQNSTWTDNGRVSQL